MIRLAREECSGCGICVEACPEGAILLREDGPQFDRDLCTRCGECVEACPERAIVIEELQTAIAPAQPQVAAEIEIRPQSGSVGLTLAPLAGIALAMAERWLATSVVDALVGALSRRRVSTGTPAQPMEFSRASSLQRWRRGKGRGQGNRRRVRRRGR